MNPLNASQSTVCGLAWQRYSRQTPLRDVALALNGRASLAGVRPCRTGAASFMTLAAVCGGTDEKLKEIEACSMGTNVQRVPRALFPAFRGRPSVPAILTIHFALRRDIGAIRTIPKRDGRRHGSKANAAGGLTNAAAPSGA